jgi:acyl-CoA thioesterase YciA
MASSRFKYDDGFDPDGDLILRTATFPGDTNPNGDIFGGWLMSQMDIAGGILASETAKGRVVTVAVDSFKFLAPVKVGEIVCCHGHVKHIGNTSLRIHLEVWVKPRFNARPEGKRIKVTEAEFIYVAINDAGKKRPIPRDAKA